ncbi:hypothetical protein C4D60_Mb10t13820 [Musa balbisiana]|uniref:PHD finger protein ALFIN-LIKE n=1 Tax=Musa balbisiana TaxID=52838 RepID=A0A4S8IX10_MUSBA|nr:hypothetical protein C4D60_Mb10t13820 [Musa balbisiana]
MEGGAADYNPRTPEDVFRDFRSRRAGMIKALTTDVEKFYQQCDPGGVWESEDGRLGGEWKGVRRITILGLLRISRRAGMIKALTTDVEKFYQQCDPEKENLCLYGLPNETWEVNLPAEEVPAELPEPALGINFARDGMAEKDWLSLVAVHSDAWLLSVAFYFGARFGFDKEARKRLFHMINGLPTIYEVVTGTSRKQSKERTNNSSKSNKSGLKNSRQSESYTKASKMPPPKEGAESEGEDNEDMEEHGNTLCGACGDNYANDEFWICCDVCEKWYHGKCVKITPARAEHIKQYKCPGCSTKRARA